MAGDNNIACHAVVVRVGEIFAEFGFEFDPTHLANDVTAVTKWGLHVDLEDVDGSPIFFFEEEMPIEKHQRVVKLQAGGFYLARVRVYSEDTTSWGEWSEAVRTATLHPVLGEIKDIGEDYVRVQWNRRPRVTVNIAAEKDPEASRGVADILDLELRILREKDMVEAFCDRFAVGVRTCTVHGLWAGTAYIAMIRYKTLIHTLKNWTEVGRFYTKPANILSLVSRGEDVIKLRWCLGPSPVDAVGYILPETTVHLYEVTVEGENVAMSPAQVPENRREHRVEGLSPGTLYTFYVRSLSLEGFWGSCSEPFKVRTADAPEVSVVARGETFLSFTWMRQHDEPEESQVEYRLQSLTTTYKQHDVVPVGPCAEDKTIHLLGLTAGTEYTMSIRTFLQDEWGLWTEPQVFRTQSKTLLIFVERGEDFFTLALEEQNEATIGARFNVVVSQVCKDGNCLLVLDEEIVHNPDELGFRVGSLQADTLYEVKCRRWQHNHLTGHEGWGEFTTPIRTQTLQHLALYVWDIGEDFAQLIWRRGLADTETPGRQSEQLLADLKYEVVVGCVDTGEDDIVHRQVLQTSYTITNLRPATTYTVSVRACNEMNQWGMWSKVKLRTLASVSTSVHEIGEDFVRLMWERENIDDDECLTSNGNNGSGTMGYVNRGAANTATADMFVSRYAIFVYSRENGEAVPSTLSGYQMGGNSEVVRYEVVSSEHTSLRISDLLPDREYVAVVRASTATGKWGLWSRPLYFRSNPQFRIPVNNLAIGENYVNLVWSRDACPVVDSGVFVGDLSVTGQQLRIQGVDTPYSKDHTLPADMRELKIYGLSPATAYTIQIRVSGKSGDWGRWSPPVHILTRDTILTKAVEVAEDYIIIAWERRKVANPKNYPTGRGVVTSYHLRVYNKSGVHSEVFLGDGDSPYRISDMTPDTYYCIEMKANYNNEEWGLWSTPMWCLTMKTLEVQAKLISEEFCHIVIHRPYQQKRLPEDDGNRASDDRIIAFGQFRPNLMLCVTSPIYHSTPHTLTGHARPRQQNSSLPPDSADHRLIYQTDILCASDDTDHAIPNLRSNTVYSASVRSKLVNGEWGMWSQPSLLFATVPATQVEFTDIGEKFVMVNWTRSPQRIPPQIQDSSTVKCGLGTISASRVKIREVDGSFQETYDLKSSLTTLRLDNLSPSTTYAVSVQTYNDNYEWGIWSEEGKVRTISGIDIAVQHISEDAVWVAWMRKLDAANFVNFDTALNVDVVPGAYEVRIVGGGHFEFSKEMDTNKLFFRGLQPDTVYSFQVRAQSLWNQEWGLWSSQSFRTKSRIRVTFGNVGEHFAIVEWRRHLPTSLDERDVNTVVESEDVVQQFRLKVECVGTKVTYLYDLSPYISSFHLKDLQPSAEYRVWLCAKGFEGVWGFWNDEARVRTLPKLELDVTAVGEDYVMVSWVRGKWLGETVGGSEASVREVDGAVSAYKVRVLDVDGTEIVSQSISFRETSCMLSPLKLSTVYSVQVSAKDTYDEWGLWSDPKYFMTLESVDLRILQIGEAFVEVEWGRCRDLLQRRRQRRLQSRYKRSSYESMSDELHDGSKRTSERDVYKVEKDNDLDENKEEKGRDEEEISQTSELEAGREQNTNKSYDYDDFDGSNDSDYDEEQFEDEENSIEDFDGKNNGDDALVRGDASVLQWHLRVQGQRIFGGQPGVEDFAELYVAPEKFQCVIDALLPHAAYAVSVRARDKAGVWGNWSQPRKLITYPLLALTAESVTETFIQVSWNRPPFSTKVGEGFICFPPVRDIHNYQVHIEPLATEPPFDERDESLVCGARVYETSQPSMRLWNLTPGVRYRVVVREQKIDAKGNFVPDAWGGFSAMQVVEMVQPMSVTPIEIGEDYCLVGWGRVQRPPDVASDISFVTGKAKITGYELRAVRLDAKASKQYYGPLALDTVVPLEANATSYHLGNLVSNTIYALRIRAQMDGYWGPWSAVTKFVSQSRLEMKVCAVYEDTFAVVWSRPLPEWALLLRSSMTPSTGTGSPIRDIQRTNAVSTFTKSGTSSSFGDAVVSSDHHDSNVAASETPDKDEKRTDSALGESMDDLDAVLLGDYSVDRYELYVDGVTCNLQRCLIIPKEQMSACITGLQHNQIYSVCIRSQSAKQHWSMLSRRESFLTLSPMCVQVLHYTENMALIHWHRAPQDVMDYASFLQKRRAEEERRCDEDERQNLFVLKRRAQEMEASKERKYLEDQLAVRREHNSARRMDAVHYLKIENITLGNADVTGYHLVLEGEAVCMPFISGLNRMLLQQQKQHSLRKRRQDSSKKVTSKLQRQKEQTNVYSLSEEASAVETAASEAVTNDSLFTKAETSLINVQLCSNVDSVVVKDLVPLSQFSLRLRARNAECEWCPWSQWEKFTTLQPIELHHSRFGEHYINLYWHRLSAAFLQGLESDEQRLQELNSEFSHMSPRDLEDKKKELSDEAYNVLVKRLKSWRDLKRSVADMRMRLMSGHGEVMVHKQTPVKAYQLRVIDENGSFKDHLIETTNSDISNSADDGKTNDKDESVTTLTTTTTTTTTVTTATTTAPTTTASTAAINIRGATEANFANCAFTVTGLVSNTMYVALLCADYGFGWGPWTMPLKFMTQNLIQLSIIYVSEVFVDLEWRRAPNKRLPPMDEGTTLTSDAEFTEGRVFQVRITHEKEEEGGKVVEEYRTVRSCNVFRVDKLRADTKYTFAVCEWDSEGDWGLWCAPKACVTLPGMKTTLQELGEDWAHVTWGRQDRCVDYDDELDVLQLDLEKVAYYLMVQEIPDNELEVEGSPVSPEEAEENVTALADMDEIEGILISEQQFCGRLPPGERPMEFEGERNGRFCLIRRFGKDTVSFRIENLRADKFYKVQVMCETTEDRLGAWSGEQYFLTMPKICLTAKKIDEEYVDLTWERAQPRQHPRLNMNSVYTGHYTTIAYVLEVVGGGNFYLQERLQGSFNTAYHLKGLAFNTLYGARVYSINDENQQSLWSETLRFVTLDRLMVQPTEIAEQSIILEWGRQLQQPICEETDGQYDSTVCVGCRESNTYFLRVTYGGESSSGVLLEKSFPGDVSSFHLTSLEPNTPYVVSVRAMNHLGEWGLWSEERCVYTMKLITAEVAAVGEDYIRLCWMREEPDELQVVDSPNSSPYQIESGHKESREQPEGENSGSNLADGVNNPSSGSGTRPELDVPNRRSSQVVVSKKYPLLDRPEQKSVVYNSAKTRIMKYCINVVRPGEDEDYTIDVSGDATNFTISSLRPDTPYFLSVRACYDSGMWGVSSASVGSGTLNMLAVELRGLGEDYLTAAWQRLPLTYDTANINVGNYEETTCYEIAVHDFTDVSFGEEDAEDLAPRLWRTVFSPAKSRLCTVKELLSHHRYRVSVRRWYKPTKMFVDTSSAEVPVTDDEQVLELIRSNNSMPGKWSDCLYDVTLRDMVCTMEEGAEDFFVVRWERDPRVPALLVLNPFPAMPAQGYHLRIDEMTPDGTAVDTGAASTHIDVPLDANETSYRAKNMKPDTLYRIDIRCCVDNVWGHWSRSLFVMTLPKFVVDISSIGEDYALFSWQRPRRNLVLADGTEVFSGINDSIDKFHLEVIGLEHKFHVNKKLKAVRNTYRVKQLEANTVYLVSVRSLNSRRDAWSLWSQRAYFATLKPMRLVLGPAAEHFVILEWYRDLQRPEEYRETVMDENAIVHLGNPDVIAYHLCVFMGQHAPALAVVDKQFPRDVTRYCLGSLEADTPYVVILRACNTESRWGLWSRESIVRTQRLLNLHMTAVGENYVRVNMERAEAERAEEGRYGGTKAEPIMYQLLLKTGMEAIERVIQPSECSLVDEELKKISYVMNGLSPMTSYLMALQPGYEENRWGLWTPTISFQTLRPIVVTTTSIGSDYMVLSMCRQPEVITSAMSAVGTENDRPEPPVPSKSALRYQVILSKNKESHHRLAREGESDTNLAPPATGETAATKEGGLFSNEPDMNISTVNTSVFEIKNAGIFDASCAAASIVDAVDVLPTTGVLEETGSFMKGPQGSVMFPEESSVPELRDGTGLWSRAASVPASQRRRLTLLEREVEVTEDDPVPTTCELRELESATSYKVSVRAMDVNGFWGAWTESVFETAPLPPHSVTLHRLNAQFCMLQWEAPDNRNLYLYVVEQAATLSDGRSKTKGGVDWRVIDTVEDEFCRIRFTTPPNKMRCRVKAARVGEGHAFSDYCEPVKLSSGTPPEPVTDLLISELGRSSITVSWSPSRTATSNAVRQARSVTYRVYLAPRDRTPILLTTTSDTSHVLEELEPLTEYTVQIVVENCDGMSYNNPMIRVMTKSEEDDTIAQHESGQPPLGSIVEPMSSLRRAILPEIANVRPALVPQPPPDTMPKKRRGKSVVGASATMGAAPVDVTASRHASMLGEHTVPTSVMASRGTGQRKQSRLPSLKKKKH